VWLYVAVDPHLLSDRVGGGVLEGVHAGKGKSSAKLHLA
jgi:hypothetical protein